MAANSDSGLEKLTCPICLELYWSPRLLPCHHTICLPCLQDLAARQDNTYFPCPLCRRLVQVPPGGVAKFQINFYLMDELAEAQREAWEEISTSHLPSSTSTLHRKKSPHQTMHHRADLGEVPIPARDPSMARNLHTTGTAISAPVQVDWGERLVWALVSLILRICRLVWYCLYQVGRGLLSWYLSCIERLGRLDQKVVFTLLIAVCMYFCTGPYVACTVFLFELYLFVRRRF